MSVKSATFSAAQVALLVAYSNDGDDFWFEDGFAETYDGLGRLYPEDDGYRVETPGKTRFYTNLGRAVYAMFET